MCDIWTIQQYRDAAAKPESGYTITGEFLNREGQVAIQVRDRYGDYRNIYSDDGKSTSRFYSTADEATDAAHEAGFKLIIATTTTIKYTVEQFDLPGEVQGKTLEEWLHEGELNDEREVDEHVHPDLGDVALSDLEPGDLRDAYINSLNTAETIIVALGVGAL